LVKSSRYRSQFAFFVFCFILVFVFHFIVAHEQEKASQVFSFLEELAADENRVAKLKEELSNPIGV
jgi:hypothetical protein